MIYLLSSLDNVKRSFSRQGKAGNGRNEKPIFAASNLDKEISLMKGKFLMAGASLIFALAGAGSAWAGDDDWKKPCPSDNEYACKKVDNYAKWIPGKDWKDSKCIVVIKKWTENEDVHPGCKEDADKKKFEAEYKVIKLKVIKRDKYGVCDSEIITKKKLVECRNPAGNPTGSLEPCICPNGNDDKGDDYGDKVY